MAVIGLLLAALVTVAHAPARADAATATASTSAVPISQAKPISASTTVSSTYAASKANDGHLTTRWAAKATDMQWITIDLGSETQLSSVKLKWAEYAQQFDIRLSTDGTTWTTGYATTSGSGGTQTISLSGTDRYVRMLGLKRGTKYGYSLWEFQVFGTKAPSASGVQITGTQGHWQLTVGGQPFTVQGVTYDPAVMDPETYLPDVASMGANTVRDWGTDTTAATDSFYLAAEANHIRVIAGIWIDYGQDWTNNAAYQTSELATIKSIVTKYKSSSAVLMWDVGNEVMANLASDAQRDAYAQFIEKATEAIHAIDPNHPVTSTDAQTAYWPIYQQYAPSLDLFALNTYAGISGVDSTWHHSSFTKPYIVTETGPIGYWESDTDANGQPVQPSDTAMAADYTAAWNDIVADKGVALGGTMFHYSDQTDLQSLWFSLNPGNLRRASFYALERAWTGSAGSNTPPVISSVTLPASVTAGGEFSLVAPATDPDGDTVSYSLKQTSATVADNGTATASTDTQTSAGHFTVTAPSTAGVWRFYVEATDGHGNVDIESRTVKVVAAG